MQKGNFLTNTCLVKCIYIYIFYKKNEWKIKLKSLFPPLALQIHYLKCSMNIVPYLKKQLNAIKPS